MALSSKTLKFYRSLYITSRLYSNKSIYEMEEEAHANKTKEVYDKTSTKWRKHWIDRDGEWKSKLSVFVEKNPNPDILSGFSKLPDLKVEDVKEWWRDMKFTQEIVNQKYLIERVSTLGSNLAAVHFFTYRFCAVRLRGSSEWIKGDITNLVLPDHYEDGWYVEAVDCSTFHKSGIHYEGIENLKGLNFLKWLSLKNNRYVDVWCIDRLAGQNGHTLEYLDVSGCNLCVGCITALTRMSTLKYLVVTDPGDNLELQSALSLLEEYNSNLLIKAVEKDIMVKTNK